MRTEEKIDREVKLLLAKVLGQVEKMAELYVPQSKEPNSSKNQESKKEKSNGVSR